MILAADKVRSQFESAQWVGAIRKLVYAGRKTSNLINLERRGIISYQFDSFQKSSKGENRSNVNDSLCSLVSFFIGQENGIGWYGDLMSFMLIVGSAVFNIQLFF